MWVVEEMRRSITRIWGVRRIHTFLSLALVLGRCAPLELGSTGKVLEDQ